MVQYRSLGTSPQLLLTVHGPLDHRRSVIVKHTSPKEAIHPTLWSGSSPHPWALTLKDRHNYVDLICRGRSPGSAGGRNKPRSTFFARS